MLKEKDISVAKVIQDMGLDISNSTGRRIMYRLGLKGRKPRKKPFIRAGNRKKRQMWAKNWMGNKWEEVLFTDEKKWVLHKQRRNWVWRRVDKGCNPQDAVTTMQAGGGLHYGMGHYVKDQNIPPH